MLVLIGFQSTESGVDDVGEVRLGECRARQIMGERSSLDVPGPAKSTCSAVGRCFARGGEFFALVQVTSWRKFQFRLRIRVDGVVF